MIDTIRLPGWESLAVVSSWERDIGERTSTLTMIFIRLVVLVFFAGANAKTFFRVLLPSFLI